MKNIVLTGFMASGKTVIGKELANMMKFQFIDTDDQIELLERRRINDIFDADGEEYFRELETSIAQTLSDKENAVISTGGGFILRTQNLDYLRNNGIIFNLSPDFEVIRDRLEIAQKTRPLLQNQDIDEVYKRFCDRQPFYDNCDYKIHIIKGKSPRNIANEIIDIYKTII